MEDTAPIGEADHVQHVIGEMAQARCAVTQRNFGLHTGGTRCFKLGDAFTQLRQFGKKLVGRLKVIVH